MGDEFLGVGWKFPVQKDASGDVALAEYEADVREAIEIILRTAPGERVMRPDFGCGIHALAFEAVNSHTINMARFHVEEALNQWEPRILLHDVRVQADAEDPAAVMITIDYTVRSTDSRFNLVFPFYLERSG